MEKGSVNYKNSRINFGRWGSGPSIALCFHGYGEDAQTFKFLAKYAGNQYTFIAIDLPFHGQTEWKDTPDFTMAGLLSVANSIIAESNLKPETRNLKLTLIGFSLGGRIALSLFESMPERVDRLVLLAPDGLKVNFWYWLSTQTWLGNKFFAFTMKKPGWFFGFLKLLNKLKLVNASIFKFVNYYIGDSKVRKLLYDRWTTLRKIRPHLAHIKDLVRHHEVHVRLIYGKHDRIILPSVGEKFCSGIEEYSRISVIHSGHQVLHEKHAEEIVPALQS